jgi:hypothetical protein
MTETYYDRETTTFIDGTPIFKTEEDEKSENEISKIIEDTWKCQLFSFGKLSVIDWYAVRTGRLVGLLELKTRTHDTDKYDTVFLNVRKWLALNLAAVGMGIPALFVVRFSNAVKFISISDIDASDTVIGGLKQIKKSRNDIEPLIRVPVTQMTDLIVKNMQF